VSKVKKVKIKLPDGQVIEIPIKRAKEQDFYYKGKRVKVWVAE
jgi:hypothetical protein